MVIKLIFQVCFLGFIFFVVSACEEEITLGNDEFESRVVVNSLFSPETAWEISLSCSRNVLDPSSVFDPKVSAEIQVFDSEGMVYAEFYHSHGDIYQAKNDVRPRFGHTYTLKVSVVGFKTLYATSRVPEPLKIDAVSIYAKPEYELSPAYQIDLRLVDTDIGDNYFVWELSNDELRPIIQDLINPINENTSILLSTNDENAIQVLNDQSYQSRIFMTDSYFDNGIYLASFSAPGTINQHNQEVLNFEEVNLKVMSVSHELFEYYKSVERYRWSKSFDPRINPSFVIYSNIENGLGVFAGYSQEIIHLKE